MSAAANQIAAMTCCYFMRRHGFKPATVINAGIGKTSPELEMWKWLLPDAAIVGIDPRWSPRGNWQKRYRERQIVAALGDGTASTGNYCGMCRSVKCTQHPERHVPVPMTTLDLVASELEPPYFIWMDIDGGERDALRGATDTLKQTGWINIEVHKALYGPENAPDIQAALNAAGFRLHYSHYRCDDVLFRNRRYSASKP